MDRQATANTGVSACVIFMVKLFAGIVILVGDVIKLSASDYVKQSQSCHLMSIVDILFVCHVTLLRSII